MDTDNEYSEIQSEDMIKVEDSSWWFNYRVRLLKELLKKYFDTSKYLFDIGGGNGVMSKAALEFGYNAVLMEPSKFCCNNAVKRGIKNVYQGTLSDANIKDNTIYQIMINDVLEHIEDDCAFAKLMYKKMSNGGVGLVMVPAMKWLWSSEDSFDGHFRRYSIDDIKGMMQQAGFEIVYSNYFFKWLCLPIFVVRVLGEKFNIVKKHEARTQEEADKVIDSQFIVSRKSVIGWVLECIMSRELGIVMKRHIRYGSSLFVVIRKSEKI